MIIPFTRKQSFYVYVVLTSKIINKYGNHYLTNNI